MANDTTKEDKKEKREKIIKQKPTPYIINSEVEKEHALLEIQEMLEKIENDSELNGWEDELEKLNKRAVELKSQINDRKKSASSEKKGMTDRIELMKSGIADYEVNKAIGKIA